MLGLSWIKLSSQAVACPSTIGSIPLPLRAPGVDAAGTHKEIKIVN